VTFVYNPSLFSQMVQLSNKHLLQLLGVPSQPSQVKAQEIHSLFIRKKLVLHLLQTEISLYSTQFAMFLKHTDVP